MTIGAGPSDEEELVRRYRAGDVTAFEELYRLHHRYVEQQARRVLDDVHRAQDVSQEAFLRLTRQLLGSDAPTRVRPWLHRTTVNLAIDEQRRARARHHLLETPPLLDLPRSLEQTDEGHPVRMAERSEMRALLTRAVAELPERHRRALLLREVSGLDYPAIGAAMGISTSAVESLLFRARRRLGHVYLRLSGGDAPAARTAGRPGRTGVTRRTSTAP